MQHQAFISPQSDKPIDLVHDVRFVPGSDFTFTPQSAWEYFGYHRSAER
jgi:hypothetical protein